MLDAIDLYFAKSPLEALSIKENDAKGFMFERVWGIGGKGINKFQIRQIQ